MLSIQMHTAGIAFSIAEISFLNATQVVGSARAFRGAGWLASQDARGGGVPAPRHTRALRPEIGRTNGGGLQPCVVSRRLWRPSTSLRTSV